MHRDLERILPEIISPYDQYCSSCGTAPLDCYVAAPLLAVGVAKLAYAQAGSKVLDRIVAFDRAQSSFVNITQTNLIRVSSFNGLNGTVWGYDLATQAERRHHLVSEEMFPNVYDLEPILLATRELFGTVHSPHFPIAPGQHLLCAYKTAYENGPATVYGALAVAIAKDRSRNADLFMEDNGTLSLSLNEEDYLEQQARVLQNLIESVHDISCSLCLEYEKIFVSLKCRSVASEEVACVIAAVPYVKVARLGIPGNPLSLKDMSFGEWQARSARHFMSGPPAEAG